MTYDIIYGRFYTLVSDPDFFKQDETYAYELMSNWLHAAVSESYIRKKFSSILLDDEVQTVTYTLSNTIDKNSDEEFVISVFAQYMVIQWMRPKIENNLNLSLMIGTDKEKKIRDNYKQNIDRVNSLETKLRKYIRDYGYIYNDYLSGGES